MATNNETDCYKYLKLTTDSISVSDSGDSKSYADAISFSKRRITFSSLFQLYLGSESLEDFIKSLIIKVLSKWIEFDYENNTLRFRTPVRLEQTLEVDGDLTVNSDAVVSSSLKVVGDLECEGGIVEVKTQ